ncbi:unnamed protein product, partial [Prorocentrum cordatum]
MSERRRAQVDQAIASLNDRVAAVESTQAPMGRRLDAALKSTSVVCEGFERCGTEWAAKAPGGQWRELKAAWGQAVAGDLRAQLGIGPGDAAVPEPALDAPVAHAVAVVGAALSMPGVISGLFAQTRWSEADGAHVPVPNTYKMVLEPCLESLQVQSALRVLDHPLRRKAGLAVAGVAPAPLAAGQPPPRRVLMYTERTRA